MQVRGAGVWRKSAQSKRMSEQGLTLLRMMLAWSGGVTALRSRCRAARHPRVAPARPRRR
eukprot:1693046-Rhodomonas_salina.3